MTLTPFTVKVPSIPGGNMLVRMSILAGIMLLFAATASQAQEAPSLTPQRFEGHWWHAAPNDEQVGFLYGLEDCLTFDRKPARWFDQQWIWYQRKISTYYDRKAANVRTPVQATFARYGHSGRGQSDERYGVEFWKAHKPAARTGFLEGYISCRLGLANAPRLSRPIEFYQHKLDDMYNVDDREEAKEFEGSVAQALSALGGM